MGQFLAVDSRIQPLRSTRWLAILCVAATALIGLNSSVGLAQPNTPTTVYVVPIEGMIDLGLSPFVRRVLEEARYADAAAVVLEINTLGGRVDAAIQIRDTLLTSPVRTIAYVNPRAISAGALIALAAEKVVMAPGGTIGAATPVQVGAPNTPAQPVEEKTVSYVRKEFRATAEHRGRPPLFAEALLTSLAFGAAAALLLIAAHRLSGSLIVAVTATVLTVALFPRPYAYPKVLLYVAGPLVMWA